MDFDLGFALIGEDMDGTAADLSDVGPASIVPIDQDTYVAVDEGFDRGEHAGWMHGIAVLTHRDRLVCQLVFSFDGRPEDSIVVHGVLPRDDGAIGAGWLAVTGGTGRFHKASGTVRVDTQNPKRFGFTF
jgi:hypothetical protein